MLRGRTPRESGLQDLQRVTVGNQQHLSVTQGLIEFDDQFGHPLHHLLRPFSRSITSA